MACWVVKDEEFAETCKLPDPESTTNLESEKVWWCTEETMNMDPSINDRFPKKRDDLNRCRLSIPDGLIGAKCVMIDHKVIVGCVYGDVGKPFCAVKPVMEALSDDVFGTADIFVTTTCNKDIITVDQYMRKMMNNALPCNIGHFDNFYIQGFYIQGFDFEPQMDEWVFPDTKSGIIALAEGRLMNLGCATDHPNFVMSCSFTKQVIAQLELWNEKSGKYEEKVYLDEKGGCSEFAEVAKITKLSPEQAAYINVPIEGPYEPAH